MESKQAEFTSAKPACVAFLGDSTLDNIVWVEKSEDCIASLVRSELGQSETLHNYAADAFNSHHVLRGATPMLSMGARKDAGDPFPSSESGVFEPLVALKAVKDEITHIVLSVGGNDVREILGHMGQLGERIGKFRINYAAILKECLQITPNVIIMMQYRPSLNQDHHYGVYRAMASIPGAASGGISWLGVLRSWLFGVGPEDGIEQLNSLMESVYPPILAAARRHRLAVLDLPRSFDIRNDALYSHQIEPSADGGRIIARLVMHALRNHDFGESGASKIYRLDPHSLDIVIDEANDGSREWKL